MKDNQNFKLQKELLKEGRKNLRVVLAKMKIENDNYAKVYATGNHDLIDAEVKKIEDNGLIWGWREAKNAIHMSSFRMRRIITKSRKGK